jgi:hypothetical protein
MITEQQKNKIAQLTDTVIEANAAVQVADEELDKSRQELEDYLKSLVEGDESNGDQFEIKAVRKARR